MSRRTLHNPKPERTTDTPEVARIDPNRTLVDHLHPSAIAFAVFGDTVALARQGVHHTIFAAVKAVVEPQSAPRTVLHALESAHGAESVYSDYSVAFYPHLPSGKALSDFMQIPNELHARRSATLAGRAWLGVSVEGCQVAIVSWWVVRSQVSSRTVALIAEALGLTGTCLFEFRDSRSPQIIEFPATP